MNNFTGRYAAITPVRNEVANLPRLAEALFSQTLPPTRWIIVDTGSTDATVHVARDLASKCDWIAVDECETARLARGAPIVRAFHAGLKKLGALPEVVVKLDADTSFGAEHFEQLMARFAADPKLGIASGIAYEMESGEWKPRFNTANSVWGADRAYRRECLQEVLPLEEYMGWDGIDELKARGRGWHTTTFNDIPFRHHRSEGERDGASWRGWAYRGRAAHYMGYRFWYLSLRALRHAGRDLSAIAMLWGFVLASVKREPLCPDQAVRERLRGEQNLRTLRSKIRDTSGLRVPTRQS
jgi:glycosyltransferase involved in cell wall biosynthesis